MARKKSLSVRDRTEDDAPEDGGKLSAGPGRESFKMAGFWLGQIEAVDHAYARYHRRGINVLKRYRDERGRADENTNRKMNLLWANTKVMKPAIYSQCPIPVVDRKFLDKDPVGRISSVILERTLINEMGNNFHEAMNMAVYDRLLPGRGVVWLRYEPKIGDGDSIPASNADGIEDPIDKIKQDTDDPEPKETEKARKVETTGEEVIEEKVVVDYVDWRDFYIFPASARTWAEVQAIGKKVRVSKVEAKERFGDKIGSAMQPDTKPINSEEKAGFSDTQLFRDINERAIVVYEIWNKSDLKVYWVSPGYDYLCDVMPDPLGLVKFFPVPPVLQSTTTNDSLIPIPDYLEWQDQALQIDDLTARIALLTSACKVAGVYNARDNSIARLLDESVENQLIPVDQWAMFAETGGLKGAIDFLPLDTIQSCLETLQATRQQCMLDLDQITGLSDIMRGTSDSRETLGGIRLKNNNAGTRLSEAQEQVAQFARDAIRIMAEIVAKQFSDETLIESSGILFEDELQPDAVIREFQASLPTPPQPMAPPGQPPQQQGQPPAGAPGHPGMPGQQPQPQQAPGTNVVPFPKPQQQPGQQQPMGGNMPMPPMPMPDPEVLIYKKIHKAIELLRKDVTRSYRIDIETESTIFGDKVQNRQDATEFITAVGQFMTTFETISQTTPEAMPLLGKLLQWGVRKYRTGRDLESEVDNFVISMIKSAKQKAANPQPNPEQMKAQVEMQKLQAKAQMDQQNDQRDAQRQQQEYAMEQQQQQLEAQREAQKMQMEEQRNQRESAMEMQFKEKEHQLKMMELEAKIHAQRESSAMKMKEQQMKTNAEMQTAAIDAHSKQQEHSMNVQEHEHNLRAEKETHELKMKEAKDSHGLKMKEMNTKHTADKQKRAELRKDKAAAAKQKKVIGG